MAEYKIEIRPKTDDGTYPDIAYPKTTADMVVDEDTGQTVAEHLGDKNNPHNVSYSQVGAPSKNEFDNHVNDNTSHVTATEKGNWNAKQDSISGKSNRFSNTTIEVENGVGGGVIKGINSYNSTSGLAGVYGESSAGIGALGAYINGLRAGVYGEKGTHSSANLAGYFNGDVRVEGDLNISGNILGVGYWQTISDESATSDTSSVYFSNIPSRFNLLRIIISAQNNSSGINNLDIRFNGVSSSSAYQWSSGIIDIGSGAINGLTNGSDSKISLMDALSSDYDLCEILITNNGDYAKVKASYISSVAGYGIGYGRFNQRNDKINEIRLTGGFKAGSRFILVGME